MKKTTYAKNLLQLADVKALYYKKYFQDYQKVIQSINLLSKEIILEKIL